jgi:hypothetical protein
MGKIEKIELEVQGPSISRPSNVPNSTAGLLNTSLTPPQPFPGKRCVASSSEERDTDAAVSRVQALALRVVAERLEHGEAGPQLPSISFAAA